MVCISIVFVTYQSNKQYILYVIWLLSFSYNCTWTQIYLGFLIFKWLDRRSKYFSGFSDWLNLVFTNLINWNEGIMQFIHLSIYLSILNVHKIIWVILAISSLNSKAFPSQKSVEKPGVGDLFKALILETPKNLLTESVTISADFSKTNMLSTKSPKPPIYRVSQ